MALSPIHKGSKAGTKTQLLILTLFFFVFSLCSCVNEDAISFKKVEKIKFNNISKEGISLDIKALIENNTAFRFKISDADLDIMLNQVSIGQVRLKEDCLIKRNRAASYDFMVEASYSDLLSGGIASLVNLAFKKKIRVACKGWIEIKKWGIKRKVPVIFDEDVDVSGTGLRDFL